jgi:hypothetical protein
MVIQQLGGLYLYGWIGREPIWTDNLSEAKHFASEDDTAVDEARLDALHVYYWVLVTD